MTQDEAMELALKDGLRPEQITSEILRLYGHTPPAPTAEVKTGAVIVPEQIKKDLEALEAEAKANSLPANIVGSLKNVLGFVKTIGVIVLLVALMFGVCGCSTKAAQQANAQAAVATKALNDQHLAFESAMVSYYRSTETARIDELHAQAVKSATKTVDGKEFIETNVAAALNKQRFELLANVETKVGEMRAQQASICENYAAFVAYNEGLQAYFTKKASTFEALKAGQDALLDFLKGYAAKK